jgi:UPF0755 protein
MSEITMKSVRFIIAIALLLFIGTVGYLGISFALFAFSPARAPTAPGGEKSAIILVKKGMSHGEIAKALVQAEVLSDAKSFNWLGRITRKWQGIKTGEYRFTSSMSPVDIFQVLNSGVSINHPVTVREGENIYEIAADIEAKGLAPKDAFLALVKNPAFIATMNLGDPTPKSLEGYLFPDTYFFSRSQSLQEMVQQMVKKFHFTWLPEHEAQAKVLKLTKHQVITLASIIEKETGATTERALISSVFHNRLKKGMRLQSDPTTIYGIWERYKGNIHRSDLQDKNPYNTYAVAGLPIGPISNPGLEAIKAALYPATSAFLFFVSHNDGTHEFTQSLADHEKAVLKFQVDKKAREGKSWRDLYKVQQKKD